jgi:4-hydroxybenzoate polyprenyltransferase
VFSPLKHTYRKLLNKATSWSESTVLGKQMMIKCIVEARKQAITAHNIKAGWRASGLWPVNMAKPLMSRLLLENSNKVPSIDEQTALIQTPVSRLPSQGVVVDQGAEFATPRKKIDLRGHLNNLAIRKQDLSTRRLLFRKVKKAFDQKDSELARLRQENEALKIQLEVARPSRRKKVVTDPNSVFASIEDIHRAQIDAGRIDDPVAEESGSESAESEVSCIVVV